MPKGVEQDADSVVAVGFNEKGLVLRDSGRGLELTVTVGRLDD
ncbi:MAG: hypothetical protein R3B96_06135 [Pirellulaceae bacterium]